MAAGFWRIAVVARRTGDSEVRQRRENCTSMATCTEVVDLTCGSRFLQFWAGRGCAARSAAGSRPGLGAS